MDASEYFIGENERAYVNPTVSRDQQLDFVQNLRDTVGQNTAQINTATERLGTAIPSSMGGLTGSGSYFTQKYQTPQMESTANTLKATAQAKALNDLMTNYEAQMKNRATQAYRSAARRAKTSNSDTTSENPLQIITNGGDTGDDTETVSTTNWQTKLNAINSEPGGQLYYYSYQVPYREPVKTYISNLTSGDDLLGRVRQLGTGTNGQTKTIGGVKYIYLDTGQFAPSWYRVGAEIPTTAGGGA